MINQVRTGEQAAWGNRGGLPRWVPILDINTENHRTITLSLDLELNAVPGQFVMAWLPGVDQRPFSLAGATPVRLTVANVGPFSAALHALRPGDRLGIQGPYGNGFRPAGRRVLLAGGGYGAAPLAYLADLLTERGIAVEVALGARTAADLVLVERFRALGIEPRIATDDGSAGEQGRVTAIVEPLLRAGAVDTLYACGPTPMLEALESLARATNVPAQLSWEARMTCAIGICGTCDHGGIRLCVEGPVQHIGCAA